MPSHKFNKQKAFGQHFLKDEKVILSIVDAAIVSLQQAVQSFGQPCSVLEIGPGKGALTLPLIEKMPAKTAFFVSERDRDLIAGWKLHSKITRLLEGDFLKITDEDFKSLGPLVVVSNLPYSAGTAIVVRLCDFRAQVLEMTLMFQAEVAKRIYSGPSTPDRGSLSLYIQNFYDVEKILVVKPGAFQPPPKVMSEVIRLKRRTEPHIDVASEEKLNLWNDLLKTAFVHRRKMLKGNFSGTRWQNAFLKSEVDPTKRAESLNWDEWKAIWAHQN